MNPGGPGGSVREVYACVFGGLARAGVSAKFDIVGSTPAA